MSDYLESVSHIDGGTYTLGPIRTAEIRAVLAENARLRGEAAWLLDAAKAACGDGSCGCMDTCKLIRYWDTDNNKWLDAGVSDDTK